MPRARKQSNSASKSGDSTMPDFVRCELSDDQKAFVKANIPTLKEIFEAIEDLAADNYKLTLSFDEATDCFAVYLIGKEAQVTNAGLMLSAYAPVLNGAFALLLYKHVTVLGRDWTGSVGKSGNAVWR